MGCQSGRAAYLSVCWGAPFNCMGGACCLSTAPFNWLCSHHMTDQLIPRSLQTWPSRYLLSVFLISLLDDHLSVLKVAKLCFVLAMVVIYVSAATIWPISWSLAPCTMAQLQPFNVNTYLPYAWPCISIQNRSTVCYFSHGAAKLSYCWKRS